MSDTDEVYSTHAFQVIILKLKGLKNMVTIYLSMALQTFVGPWVLFQFLNLFTKSVGLLGREMSPSQGRYLHTGQHKQRINAHRHPWLKWDSNRTSQCLRERIQFMPL
jgi:hypothetical protein